MKFVWDANTMMPIVIAIKFPEDMDHADGGGVSGKQEESYWPEEDRRLECGQVLDW